MSPVPHSVKSNLLAAFRHLLKPLVRMAIKNGISCKEFSQTLKGTYVDIARKQIAASDDKATRDSIASMLNVGRGEVDGVLSPDTSYTHLHESQSTPVAKLLAGWYTDARSSGPYGVLLDLPFDSQVDLAHSNGFTFSDLVTHYCPKLSPKDLLAEAIHTECVISVGKGFYRAVKRSHVPEPLSPENVMHFARIVHNICETCERNLRTESAWGKGLFERTIFSDTRISLEDFKLFDKYVRHRGQLFADDVDNWLSSRGQPAPDDKQAVNTGIGLYHFIVNDDDEREFGNIQKHGRKVDNGN